MKWMILLLASVIAAPVWAGDLDSDLAGIQARWAEIQYQLPADKREKAFENLAGQAEALVDSYPDRAEPLIWQGIVLSTYAGAKGGLGALGLVKDARKSLDKALDIDPAALEGSAYTSLGSLYYQVPGWPLGFGDDEKARKYLLKALELNPDGIDPNYFYGDFLIEQDQPERAREYLHKALNAPERPNRPLADSGRRKEIRSKLEAL